MQVSHLKQGFRINRSVGFSFLAYLTAAAFLASPDIGRQQWLLGGGFALSLVFLLFNELSYRSIKRQQTKIKPMVIEKCTLMLPLGVGAFVAVTYLMTGQLGIFLFSAVAALQAQLAGHKRLGRWMLGSLAVLYMACLPLGYPHQLGFTASTAHPNWIMLAILTPFLLTLLQIGSVIADIVRSSQFQVTRLKSLAATDGLTGLINRRQFNQQLQAEISRAARTRRPLSLALFDIDDFKKINDFHGHQVGDRILRELGEMMRHNVRESDVPARYGGEEFALILPETRLAEGYDILERLRSAVEHTVFCLPDNPITLTLSVGVAQFDFDHGSSFELIEQADAALYEAKKQGKNRVIYGVLPTPKLNLQQMHPPL